MYNFIIPCGPSYVIVPKYQARVQESISNHIRERILLITEPEPEPEFARGGPKI